MGDPYHLKIELDWLPPTNASDSRHWKRRMSVARRAQELVYAQVFDRLPKQPLKQARLTLTRFSSIEPDFDGLVAGCKYVIDALTVKHWAARNGKGVIVDDKPSVIGQPSYQWRKVKRGKGGIMVTVEEYTDANG